MKKNILLFIFIISNPAFSMQPSGAQTEENSIPRITFHSVKSLLASVEQLKTLEKSLNSEYNNITINYNEASGCAVNRERLHRLEERLKKIECDVANLLGNALFCGAEKEYEFLTKIENKIISAKYTVSVRLDQFYYGNDATEKMQILSNNDKDQILENLKNASNILLELCEYKEKRKITALIS